MKHTSIIVSAIVLMTAGMAVAQQSTVAPPALTIPATAMTETMSSVPSGSLALGAWQKQNVFDMTNTKVGDITDMLVSPVDGKITGVIIGVGGFLGMGQKDVGVPFSAVKFVVMDGKSSLAINTNKDALSAARGLKYDGKTSTWSTIDIVMAK